MKKASLNKHKQNRLKRKEKLLVLEERLSNIEKELRVLKCRHEILMDICRQLYTAIWR